MLSSIQNNAAWLVEKGAPLEVGPAPVGTPGEAEVLIKVHAVAIEPVDNMVQATGFMVREWPFLLGQSLAGEVVEVGSAVKNVKKGDRVLGHSVALVTQVSTQAAFQNYAVLPALSVAPIPSALTFERATVLPLALSTAANGLYHDIFLGLPLPKTDTPNPEGKGKVVLVWGGSSSVGSAAIQLATASGVRVVTTASPANFSFVKSLGASSVFDYHSPSIVDDLVAELQKDGEELAGVFDAVSAGGSVELGAEGVKTDQVKAILTILDNAGTLAKSIYHDYVPSALANGSLQAKPDPVVVEGNGLEAIQKGLERQRQGVSAQKVGVKIL
ncbi:hypothetical protein JCM8097_004398 [Rhodosporidiobolus ruineniae]